MKIKPWLLVFLLVGCATPFLAPEDLRQAEFLEKTPVKRGTAYTKALRWFDKNLRYSTGASRTEDIEQGRMKMQAGYQCNRLRKPSDLKDYYLAFKLDFEAIPGAVSLRFTQLQMENEDGQAVPKAETQLSDAKNIDAIQPCLKKMVADLAKAVESTTLTW